MSDENQPGFDTRRLVQAVEKLPAAAIDDLPFGVIRLDPEGRVVFYNAAERRFSGYRGMALGRSFFGEVAPCMDNDEFRGRIAAEIEIQAISD